MRRAGMELGVALSGLGVRVLKHSPNLMVTLVNDFLDARLAELNRQHPPLPNRRLQRGAMVA